ncbi:MAG: hypothetical protein ABF679_09090 [Lentilactobacillus diolivorans]|uniref:hypothetical protein n=1 Tax=Lactobacillaceae TaxID=33958 RepID=UPI0021C2A7EF|nr:hypothetical protein [Liquorilactobacillus satsumensis]MCP9358523.1 hypothetical protein [Liquorilactobacillus satsumensis]MCP9372505.1 hypothetical protein [Liquorilactobacillus satsumensis]
MQNEVQTTSLVEVQQMVQSITKQQGINTLAFVGCGASMSELISGISRGLPDYWLSRY